MYFIKDGKKVRKQVDTSDKINVSNENVSNKNFSTKNNNSRSSKHMLFIILAIVSFLLAIWLIVRVLKK